LPLDLQSFFTTGAATRSTGRIQAYWYVTGVYW